MSPRLATSVLAVALAVAAAAPAARADIAAVWAIDDGEKIRPDDLDHPARRGNLSFDPATRRVRLFGARNELVAFQVVVEGGAAPSEQVAIQLDNVGEIRNGAIDDSDPDRYLVDRRIELFAVHNVNVVERSHDLAWAPGTAAEPRVDIGDIPDALVPIRAGGVTVPARTNQVFWIDLYIPRTATPGRHTGSLTVTACERPACKLEVELEVLAFELPDRPTTRTMVWFSAGLDPDATKFVQPRYFVDPATTAVDDRVALMRRHFQLGRRHRITLFVGAGDAPTDDVAPRLRGDWFTPAAGYDGPGQGLGLELLVLHPYGGELSRADAERWKRWVDTTAPATDLFFYTFDEPKWFVMEKAFRRALIADPVPTFVTAPFAPGMPHDIFAALASDYSVATAEQAQRAGRRSFIYNGVRPFTGSFMIDDVAISPRVNPWIQYKYGIERWFFWEATYYHDSQGKRGPIDVYAFAHNFGNRHGDVGNGDGLLLYPGRDALFPEHDQGVDRPLPSIRLLNWRRGIQDVEYLALARARGLDDLVDRVVDAMVPAALADEVGAADPVSWSEHGDDWLLARRVLADAIAGGRPPAELPPALVRPATPRHPAAGPATGGRRRMALTIAAVIACFAIAAVWLGLRRRRSRARGS